MIPNTFPTDNLVPGVTHEQDLTSGSRSLVATTRRVLVLGAMRTTGVAVADAPTRVYGESDADRLFGIGSPAAAMLRAGFMTARTQLIGSPEFWCAGLTPPAGGVAANNGTFTIAGTATAAGNIRFSVAGVPFIASVASGATAIATATAMVTAVNGDLSKIPGTVASGGTAVVTYTHNVKGVNGNDVKLRVESLPAGLTAVMVQPSNGAGVNTYTTALTNSLTKDFDDVVLGSHTSTEITAALTHLAEAWGAFTKRWRQVHFGETGSVATCTSLAGNANDQRILVHAYPDSPALPGVVAMAGATMLATRESPVYNHNGTVLPAIPPVLEVDVLIPSEVQTLLIGGCTPYMLDYDGTGQSMVTTVVTTKKTDGGVPFYDLLFVGNIRAVIWTMRQVDARVANLMRNRNVDAALVRDVGGGIYDVLKAGEKKGYLHNVDAHGAEIKAEADPDQPTRIITDVPECPVPIANQVHNVNRLFVEAPAS